MERVVKYTSLDNNYSDCVQTFIGSDSYELDRIHDEFEEWLDTYNPRYKSDILVDLEIVLNINIQCYDTNENKKCSADSNYW